MNIFGWEGPKRSLREKLIHADTTSRQRADKAWMDDARDHFRIRMGFYPDIVEMGWAEEERVPILLAEGYALRSFGFGESLSLLKRKDGLFKNGLPMYDYTNTNIQSAADFLRALA